MATSGPAIHTTCDTHASESSSPAKYCVHTVPFELQFEILSQIPPTQLFTLRRVSRSWNYMLSNPNLLEEINQQLPFLTSAPDLTSRMKRRMRMVRRKPVWVKPVTEVFPWTRTQDICHNWEVNIENMMKIWKNWAVFVQQPDIQSVRSTRPPLMRIKLRIEDLGGRARSKYQAVEVDVWEDFRRNYPGAYRKYFQEDKKCVKWSQDMRFMFRQFSTEYGKVVVRLQGSKIEHGLLIPEDSFFLIYSIPMGTLIQHIHHTHQQRKFETVELYQASRTHFLVLYRILGVISGEGFRSDGYRPDPPSVKWIYVYCLQSGSLARQIRVDFPMYMSSRNLKFDHLNRIWFPEATLSTALSYFGTQDVTECMEPLVTIPVSDLPRLRCGSATWAIVPTVPIWSKLDQCKEIIDHLRTKKNHEQLKEGYLQTVKINEGRLCFLVCEKENIPDYLLRSPHQHWLANLPALNRPQHLMAGPTPSNSTPSIERATKFYLFKLNIQTFREGRFLDPNQHNHDVNTVFPRAINSRTFFVQDEADTRRSLNFNSSVWGFIPNEYLSHSLKFSEAAVQQCLDYYILPFHQNDDIASTQDLDILEPPLQNHDHEDTVTSPHEQSPGSEEKHDHPLASLSEILPEPEYERSIARVWSLRAWATDGLVAWVVKTSGHGLRDSIELWLACYEEEWVL